MENSRKFEAGASTCEKEDGCGQNQDGRAARILVSGLKKRRDDVAADVFVRGS